MLHRKLRSSELWREKRRFSKAEAWIDILLEVRYAKTPEYMIIGNERLKCERGQSLKSMDTWALRWGWSKTTVRRFLILLQDMKQIRFESVTKTTRLTVCNYDSYNEPRTANGQQTDSKRFAEGSQTDTEEEGKEGKESKEGEEAPLSPVGEEDCFDILWKQHPNKKAKKDAQKAWKQVEKIRPGIEELLRLHAIQCRWKAWNDNGGKFVPYMGTWLRGERWNDSKEEPVVTFREVPVDKSMQTAGVGRAVTLETLYGDE